METLVIVYCGDCMFCGEPTTLKVTPDVAVRIRTWTADPNRPYVQTAFPDLTVDQREALISGSHGACYDAAFSDEAA